jgi:hypothetical protein
MTLDEIRFLMRETGERIERINQCKAKKTAMQTTIKRHSAGNVIYADFKNWKRLKSNRID